MDQPSCCRSTGRSPN